MPIALTNYDSMPLCIEDGPGVPVVLIHSLELFKIYHVCPPRRSALRCLSLGCPYRPYVTVLLTQNPSPFVAYFFFRISFFDRMAVPIFALSLYQLIGDRESFSRLLLRSPNPWKWTIIGRALYMYELLD
jgi:hypothetical protein